MLDIQKIRADFPILSQYVNGKPLVYFDNGATSQTPKVVIDSIVDYYSRYNANIHRGVHTLSQIATDAYEQARTKLQHHFNAKHNYEIIFTSGTTEGINLVANGFASILKKDDEIIVSALEHHSNIVPWQMLCEHTGAILKVIPMNYDGELLMDEYVKLLSPKTKLVFCNHISNALGTINPVEFIIEKAHEVGAAVLIDGAQAVPHLKPDVQKLNCDFYVASAHKMCGPTGVGILYGKEAVVVRSGIGKVNAAICTQILADHFDVDLVINTGIAGSLDAAIDIGDMVISTDAVQHDMDTSIFGDPIGQVPRMDTFAFPADAQLVEKAVRANQEANPDIHTFTGRIASGDQFISSQEVKERIVTLFGAKCAEMEGAAIAHGAYLNQIPCVIVRAISDKADNSASMDYPAFEKKAIEHSIRLLEKLLPEL